MNLQDLKLKLRNAGVAGAGGAGFPAYAKLTDAADTIILNCAECEPLLKLHRQVLAEYAYEILSALEIIREATGAKDVIIALKKTYKDAIMHLFLGLFIKTIYNSSRTENNKRNKCSIFC